MEFTVTYDRASLVAAAKALFIHRWHPLFPGIAAFLTLTALCVGAIAYLFSGFSPTAITFLSLGILSAIASIGAFALHRQTILKRSGEVARIGLDERVVRVDSVLGNVDLPWSSIVTIEKDEANVLLFVSRGAAIVIPKASTPSDASELLEQKRRALAPQESLVGGAD